MCRHAALIGAIMVMLTLPALAQWREPTANKRAPLALVGAGLPMLVLVGGGYLLVRRLRRKAD